jgi:hypothetical protein
MLLFSFQGHIFYAASGANFLAFSAGQAIFLVDFIVAVTILVDTTAGANINAGATSRAILRLKIIAFSG